MQAGSPNERCSRTAFICIKTVLTARVGDGGNEDSISPPLPAGKTKVETDWTSPVRVFFSSFIFLPSPPPPAFLRINLFVVVSNREVPTVYSATPRKFAVCGTVKPWYTTIMRLPLVCPLVSGDLKRRLKAIASVTTCRMNYGMCEIVAAIKTRNDNARKRSKW